MVEVIRLSNRLFQCKLDGLHECIMFSNQVSDIMVRHFAQRPFHLNVIEAAIYSVFFSEHFLRTSTRVHEGDTRD